jgi:hypothetical protein
MPRKIGYWISTAILALALLGSLTYLTGSEQVVSGFAKAGYPQHLRIVLGVAKPAAAIVLLLPGFRCSRNGLTRAGPSRWSWRPFRPTPSANHGSCHWCSWRSWSSLT